MAGLYALGVGNLGCSELSADLSDPFADEMVSFSPGTSAGFGEQSLPEVILGPPAGAGANAGSLDVLSLGCGGEIVLRFDEPGIIDGPGVDLLVFENPFSSWLELAEVSVSVDGQQWKTWPCVADGAKPVGCAGVEPVLADGFDWAAATDPASAGGDGFDLQELALTKVNFVRIRDLATQSCQGTSAGFDLDALAAVHAPW